MSKADLAVARFKEGFNCSQSVFSAYASTLGLDQETALRIAAPFGGGIGRLGETCGAVSGALMVVGLHHALVNAGDKEAKERVYALARELTDKFRTRNKGCIKCRDLLGCPIDTPEGRQRAREQGLFETLCPKFVRDAAEIVEELCDGECAIHST